MTNSGPSWGDKAVELAEDVLPDSVVTSINDLEDLVFDETGVSSLGDAILEDIDKIDWEKPYEDNNVRVERLLTFLNPVFKRAVFEWSKSGKTKGRQLNEYWTAPSEMSRFLNTDIEREMFKRFVEMTSKGDASYFRVWNAHAVGLIKNIIDNGAGDLGLVDSVKDALGVQLDEETLQERARDEFIQKERIFVGLDANAKFESVEEKSDEYREVLSEAFYQLAKLNDMDRDFTLDEFMVELSPLITWSGMDREAFDALKRVRSEDAAQLLAFMNSMLLDARIDLKSESKEDKESDEEGRVQREMERFGPGLSSLLMLLGFIGVAGVVRHKLRKWKGKESNPMFAWLSGAVSLASFGALAGQEKIVDTLAKSGVNVSGASFAEAGAKAAQFDFKGAREALMSKPMSKYELSAAKAMNVRKEVLTNYMDANYESLLNAESGVRSFVEGAVVDGVESVGMDVESFWANMIPGVNQLQYIEGREKIVEYLRKKIETSDLDVADAKKMSVRELVDHFKES